MAGISVSEITDKQVWEDFLSQRDEVNFLQSWYWGEFHQKINHKIHRSGFHENGKLIGVMLSVVEDAKRGRYLTVPGGPIINWKDKTVVSQFVEEVKKIAREEKCVFVRVRPQLISDDFSKNLFREFGFKDAPLHLHAELTSQLDITKPEDELVKNMRKSTRYELKKAGLLNIKVETSTDLEKMKPFYDLQIETAQRQKFVPFSFDYLAEQFKVFVENDMALLISSYHENNLLAQAMVIFYGKEAVYHYGASTEMGRKYPGAYAVQWEAIREAQRRGMKRYNFWGVAPEEDKTHRFYGVSVFKRGFGGEDVNYLHAQDLVINNFRYLLNLGVESLRKKVRRV